MRLAPERLQSHGCLVQRMREELGRRVLPEEQGRDEVRERMRRPHDGLFEATYDSAFIFFLFGVFLLTSLVGRYEKDNSV